MPRDRGEREKQVLRSHHLSYLYNFSTSKHQCQQPIASQEISAARMHSIYRAAPIRNKKVTHEIKATTTSATSQTYRMAPLLQAVLYTALALITSQLNQSARASPISIDSDPQATSNNFGDQNHPIRAIHYHFDQKMEPHLQLFKFNSTATTATTEDYQQEGHGNTGNSDTSNDNAICNDGSPAGYYKRLNNHSKSWIIYLQGGGFCGSEEACQHRWARSTHLMTSNYWQKSISVDGILSSEPKDNPYLWNANHIYVPYCSSDSWTGRQQAGAASSSGGSSAFAFMGSQIIERVLASLFDDLPRDSSLHEAKFILLAGDSAGATGVMLNLDRVNRQVQARFASSLRPCSTPEAPQLCEQRQVPIVRGIADSGWFLDNEPYDMYQHQQQTQDEQQQQQQATGVSDAVDCVRQRCSPLQSIRQAMGLWNGQVPAACAARHPGEPWRCYFGYRSYPSLRTPLFVVQWLYDEAQLMVDNIIRPGTHSQWSYVNKLVGELRASLENVTALFAPSCLSHSLIVKQSWNQININGFKLPHILNAWEEETLANQPNLELLLQDEHELHRQQQQQQQFVAAQQEQHSSAFSGNQMAALLAATVGGSRAADQQQLIAMQQQQQQTQTQTQRQTTAQQSQPQFEMRRSFPTGGGGASASTNPRARSRKRKRNNSQQQGQGARANAASTNRLSRSTQLISAEESGALAFSNNNNNNNNNNNVPDLLVLPTTTTSSHRQQAEGADKFRLIDSCGWPQCNRDCPSMELDFGSRPSAV